MATEQPTANEGGASSADPIDRIEAFLSAQDGGDSTGQDTQDAKAPEGADPTKAQKPDDPKGDAPAKEDEPQITTAQLASFLGIEESEIDVDDDGKPVFKTKVDGKEGSAKFADIRKSHQLGVHAENRVREAAAKEQAAQARMQEAEQAINQRLQQYDQTLQQVHALTAVAQEELTRDYKAVPWDRLRVENPGEFAARMTEFQARQGRIQGVFNEINQRRAQAQQQFTEQQQANARKLLVDEASRTKELIPEWKDPAVWAKEAAAMQEWAIQNGYDPEELRTMSKAHHVKALRSAWQHATLQERKPVVENQVRTAPKLVKPGQAATPGEGGQQRVKALKQQIKSAKPGESSKAFEAFLLGTGLA